MKGRVEVNKILDKSLKCQTFFPSSSVSQFISKFAKCLRVIKIILAVFNKVNQKQLEAFSII